MDHTRGRLHLAQNRLKVLMRKSNDCKARWGQARPGGGSTDCLVLLCSAGAVGLRASLPFPLRSSRAFCSS